MPLKAKILIYLKNPIPTRELLPERIHGLFFSVLPQKIGDALHNRQGIKPFTICCLNYFQTENFENSPETDRLILLVSFLDEGIFPYFSEGFVFNLKNSQISNREVKKATILNLSHLLYEELYNPLELKEEMFFNFLTPTTFKKGEFDYPLPDPVLIFKSLSQKWNEFANSEFKIEISPKEVVKAVQVADIFIKTRKIWLSKNSKIVGFTGKVLLKLKTKDQELLKRLNTLYKFSEFSGIGRKTPMGLGMVEFSKK